MKKRSCRRTNQEIKIHEKAVKMRKMTDEQLVQYVEDRVKKAKSEGRNEGKKGTQLKDFFEKISVPGTIHGIGATTVDKLKEYAMLNGYIEEKGDTI